MTDAGILVLAYLVGWGGGWVTLRALNRGTLRHDPRRYWAISALWPILAPMVCFASLAGATITALERLADWLDGK